MLLGIICYEKVKLDIFGLGLMFAFCVIIPFIMFGAAKCFVHMVINNEL